PSDALDNSISFSSSSGGSNVYDGCIHYIVINDLSTARSQCVVYAVDELVGGGSSSASATALSAPVAVAAAPKATPSPPRISGGGEARAATNLRPFEPAANRLARNSATQHQLTRRTSLPAIVQTVFTECVSSLMSDAADAPGLCLKYAFGTVISSSTAVTSLFSKCIGPLLTSTANATLGCVDLAVQTVFPSAAASVFTNCTQSASDVSSCVSTALASASSQSSAVSTFVAACVSPAAAALSTTNGVKAPSLSSIVGCVEAIGSALDSSSSSTSSSNSTATAATTVQHRRDGNFWSVVGSSKASHAVGAVTAPGPAQRQMDLWSGVSVRLDDTSTSSSSSNSSGSALTMATTCVVPFLQGSIDAVGAASRCVELVLTTALGSADQVFALITEAMQSILGSDVASLFSSSCFANTIKDVATNGVAQKFCEDVMVASPYSIAGGIKTYFSNFRYRVAQAAIPLVKTFVLISALGVLMAITWMAVLTLFGEGLIWFSIGASLFNITVLMIINFVILNIPGGVILLIYLVFKIGWYIWTWRKVKFAADILHICLVYLRRAPQPFFLASFLFLWNAFWCVLFAAAYLELYSPDAIPNQVGVGVTITFLVFVFFWSFEVWKGLLGTSIAGTLASWYYFRKDGAPRSYYVGSEVERARQVGGASRASDTRWQLGSPITRSFLQAVTRSFGSVCLSSALLAFLKTLHYLQRRAKNSRSAWVRAILSALLSCVESVLRVFNLYALVRVGVRHEGYCSAAKGTWRLIKERGVEAVVNDDCVDHVTGGGRWL
ncbi:putative choline transporter, neither null mutation nor overexpression affects choline transport, partial [Cladochytrium tenue]